VPPALAEAPRVELELEPVLELELEPALEPELELVPLPEDDPEALLPVVPVAVEPVPEAVPPVVPADEVVTADAFDSATCAPDCQPTRRMAPDASAAEIPALSLTSQTFRSGVDLPARPTFLPQPVPGVPKRRGRKCTHLPR
jgi:hypothetical protein